MFDTSAIIKLFLFSVITLFLCVITLFLFYVNSYRKNDVLKKQLCKYEIEYCSKEELLKRMEDK
jgi:uncharacterized membrane protein